jgi:hypothetical protein
MKNIKSKFVTYPTVSKTMTMVTSPACGMPAAPMEAAVAVIEMAITFPNEIENPRT